MLAMLTGSGFLGCQTEEFLSLTWKCWELNLWAFWMQSKKETTPCFLNYRWKSEIWQSTTEINETGKLWLNTSPRNHNGGSSKFILQVQPRYSSSNLLSILTGWRFTRRVDLVLVWELPVCSLNGTMASFTTWIIYNYQQKTGCNYIQTYLGVSLTDYNGTNFWVVMHRVAWLISDLV